MKHEFARRSLIEVNLRIVRISNFICTKVSNLSSKTKKEKLKLYKRWQRKVAEKRQINVEGSKGIRDEYFLMAERGSRELRHRICIISKSARRNGDENYANRLACTHEGARGWFAIVQKIFKPVCSDVA